MEAKLLRFPHKRLRAGCIKKYMEYAGFEKCVCFSCGNAAEALEAAGVDVLHIGRRGILEPKKWFSLADISRVFPQCFDATSGNLSIELMVALGAAYKSFLGDTIGDTVYVPSGSGETLVCLKLAYPDKKFVAVYGLDEATKYEPEAPLNDLVLLLAEKVIFNAKESDLWEDLKKR